MKLLKKSGVQLKTEDAGINRRLRQKGHNTQKGKKLNLFLIDYKTHENKNKNKFNFVWQRFNR